jgi:hypothetical protein
VTVTKEAHTMPAASQRRARPDTVQLAAMRAELHSIVDTLINGYADAHEIRYEFARGYPTSSGGGSGGSGGWSDPTFAAAVASGPDPSAVASRVIAQVDGWLVHGRGAVGSLSSLLAATFELPDKVKEKLAKARTVDGNTVEICGGEGWRPGKPGCGQPAPKVHLIDGIPLHATTCYYSYWRSRQRQDRS